MAGIDQPLVILFHEKAIELLLYMNLVSGRPPFARLRVDAETAAGLEAMKRKPWESMSDLCRIVDLVERHAYPIIDGDESGLPTHSKAELNGRHPLLYVVDEWERRRVLTSKAAAVLRTWIPTALDVQSPAVLTQSQDADCLLN
jgi:hypothetical protein